MATGIQGVTQVMGWSWEYTAVGDMYMGTRVGITTGGDKRNREGLFYQKVKKEVKEKGRLHLCCFTC